jgi:Flp pilus assembly protein TadG
LQTKRPGGIRQARGQSIVELAMILPVVLFLLLGAVDYAQVLSAEQHLENAAHVATLRLLTTPSLVTSTGSLTNTIQAESGLSPVSTGATYSMSGEGADQVVVTATYDYPLLLPGLQKLRIGALSNGKFHITVSAAGVAVTSPPTIATPAAGDTTIKVMPPTGTTVPSGLALTCTLYKNAAPVPTPQPCSTAGATWSLPAGVPTYTYTAKVMQVNGISSALSTPVSGP